MSETAALPPPPLSGRLLARNSLWNLGGQLLPAAVAFAAMGVLARALGTERFGLLLLVWAVIGYFGFLDLGLGRALTSLVAARTGEGREDQIPPLVWTSLALLATLGLVGTLLLLGLTPLLAERVLGLGPPLLGETRISLTLLGLSLPFVLVTGGLRGVLEARQRFDLANKLRVPLATLSFGGPLAALPFSSTLDAVVAVVVAVRVLGCVAHALVCRGALPTLFAWSPPRASLIRPLLRLGGWMTVSNLVAPLMVYLDRLLIAALLSAEAVAWYATPFEAVARLFLIPVAVVGVLFPAFASAYVNDRVGAARIFGQGLRWLLLMVYPPVLLVVALAPELLGLWMGLEFATHGATVMRWLALGTLLNCLSHVPLAFLHGTGRPDLSAKLHLAQLPIYLPILWLVIPRWGVEGCAIAWTLRTVADASLMFVLAGRVLPPVVSEVLRLSAVALPALAGLALIATLPGAGARALAALLFLSAFGVAGWFRLLTPAERAFASRA